MAEAAFVECSRSWRKNSTPNDRHMTQSTNLIGQNELDLVTQQDEDGDTLLHIAVAKGNEMACRYLAALFLNANKSLDTRNCIMQTPLHVSCIVDNPAVTRLLLQANPSSCDVADRHGNNCVHLAVKHSSVEKQCETLKAILELATPKSLEKKNLYGYTPMHVAAIEGKPEAIRLLKNTGADINVLDSRGGASPLILATRASQREAAQALLELGANPTLKTTYGETASQLASAKADHVISELLAFFESPGDVSKATNLPRYINTSLSSSSKSTVKQLTARQRDEKMKPFVNVTTGRHANVYPMATAIRHPMLFSHLPSDQKLNVKRERHSPANSFPGNNKHYIANSNKQEDVNASLEIISQKTDSASGESPVVPTQSLKRKSGGGDSPLDLSVKKAKPSEIAVNKEPKKRTLVNHKYPDKHTIAPPGYRQAPLPLLDRADSLTLATSSHFAPGTITSSRRSGSSYDYVTVVKTPTASPRAQHDRRTDHFQYVHLPDGTKKEILVDELKRRTTDSRVPPRHVYPHRHPDQFVPKVSTESNKATPKNGFFYPLQIVDPTILGLLNPMSLASTYQVVSHSRVQQPIRKPSHETRDKFQPTTKLIELCDQYQPMTERVALYARDKKEVKKQHPALEQIHSLPTTFQSRQNFPDEKVHKFQSSSSRERRYQSDGVCYDFNRFLDKQTANRRNSAPVQARAHNEKLDLRSYTGCLPPHYLHLLESSGNLPIRPSNALRNVADVLRGNVGNIAASKHPDKGNSAELSMRDSSTSSRTTPSDVISISGPSPNPVNFNSVSNTSTSSLSSSNATKVPLSDSGKANSNYFSELGDWSSFESGTYPAFGKKAQLDKDKIKSPPFAPSMREYTVNEKYISEDTKKILKFASSTPSSKELKVPSFRPVLSTGLKHACRGCLNVKKSIPSLISDIWRFQPFSHYVTSVGAASDVVYCWQFGSFNSTKHPAATANSDDVSKASPNEQARAASSISKGSVTPLMVKEEDSRSFLISNSERGTIPLQRSVTENLKQDKTTEVIENDNARDDMLANDIEASDDDDGDVISASTMVNGHATHTKRSTSDIIVSTKNGFHDSLSEAIQKTIMQNLERRNDVVRKLCDVRAIFSSEAKDIANDSYKDYHISDLEISDDEEVQSGRKPI